MTREKAISWVEEYFDNGRFFDDLARRVAIPTESQNPQRWKELLSYLMEEMKPTLAAIGFGCSILENPENQRMPFLLADRTEGAGLPTVLIYGHGDVILGMEDKWRSGLSPWRLTKEGNRWYGRGAADN